MDKKSELITHSIAFLSQIKNLTPGPDLETMLNAEFGPQSATWQALSRLALDGVRTGWAANEQIDGPHYRRSRLVSPGDDTFHFSITLVYMESDEAFRGQYHAHPYGEINLIAPVTEGAEVGGPRGWYGPGWTSPAPGSHHYPEVRGGGVVQLFYLPAGRISYDITPSE